MPTAARGVTTPRPFDAGRGSCENTGVKLYTFVLLLAIAACGRANDLPAMKEEAEGIVKNYGARLDELARRAESIDARGRTISVTTTDERNSSQVYATAKGKLAQLRATVANAKSEIDSSSKDRLALRRVLDRLEKDLKNGFIEVNSDFDAVESWLTLAEQRQGSQASVSRRGNTPVPPPPGGPGHMGAGGPSPVPQ